MRIDVHTHYFPWAYVDRINEHFPEHTALFGGGRPTFGGRPVLGGDTPGEIQARLDSMDEAGIDMQVLSAASYLPYLDDEKTAVDLARQCNDLYAELVARHPTRFIAYAVLPLPHVNAALEELDRAFDELGMVGVAIGSSVMGGPSCIPEFEPLYDEMNRRGAIVFGHALQCGMLSPLLKPYWSLNSLSVAVENGTFALHMIDRRIPQRFPDLKVVVPHLGGALPSLIGRVDVAWNLAPSTENWGDDPELSELPSVTLKRMWYDSMFSFDPLSLRATYDAVGVERILLGTDYPAYSDDLTKSVAHLHDSGLPHAHIHQILDENAAKLLGLL